MADETRFFRLKPEAGDHTFSGTGRTYRAGQVVETELNLMALYPNKFIEISSGSKNAKDHFGDAAEVGRPKSMSEPPVRGLPTKRTKRPAGPEETPNTEEEIMEVDQAIEDDDTEEFPKTIPSRDKNKEGQGPNVFRGSKRLLAHQKKMGRITDDDETEEIEEDEGFDDEEEAPRIKAKKAKKTAAEDDYVEETDEVEEIETEEEEAPKKKKKKKKG